MTELTPKTVLLVDDHALFREGLAFMLRGFDSAMDIVQARSAEDAVAMVGVAKPQLILLDMQLRGLSGVGAVLAVKEAFPEAMVVALSGAEDPALVLDVIGAGASGFIPKTTESSEFYAAIDTVVRGNLFLPTSSLLTGGSLGVLAPTPQDGTAGSQSNSLAATPLTAEPPVDALVKSAPKNKPNHALLRKLSPRQAEVLMLMMQGLPSKLIARNMRIGESTVKSYTQAVFQAMGVHNRTEAVFHVMRAGLSVADVSSFTKQVG